MQTAERTTVMDVHAEEAKEGLRGMVAFLVALILFALES